MTMSHSWVAFFLYVSTRVFVWSWRQKSFIAELWRSEGPPSGAPYPYRETHELICSCYRGQWHFSWAQTHDDGGENGVTQHGGHTNNRLTEACSLGLPCFTMYFFDIWDHVMFNGHLSYQVICWPVSHDHIDLITGSCQVNLLKTEPGCSEDCEL